MLSVIQPWLQWSPPHVCIFLKEEKLQGEALEPIVNPRADRAPKPAWLQGTPSSIYWAAA